MDAWFNEKTLNSFVELARGAIYAKQLGKEIAELELPEKDKEKINFLMDMVNSNLYAALYDSVKVVSIINDPIEANTAHDALEILEKGEEGRANILIKHRCSEDLAWLGLSGISSEAKSQKQKQVSEILEKVKFLIQNSSRKIRTEINSMLLTIKEVPEAEKILELLEPVTNGEKDWEDFQSEVQQTFC